MKKALKIVFNVIAWVVLIFALLITILVFSSDKNNGTASLLGYIPLTVESDSMKPTFKKRRPYYLKGNRRYQFSEKGRRYHFLDSYRGQKGEEYPPYRRGTQ